MRAHPTATTYRGYGVSGCPFHAVGSLKVDGVRESVVTTASGVAVVRTANFEEAERWATVVSGKILCPDVEEN